MKTRTLKIAALMAVLACGGQAEAQHLLPLPQKVEWQKGRIQTGNLKWATHGADLGTGATKLLEKTLPERAGSGREAVFRTGALPASAPEEAYRLRVTPDSILLQAASPTGFLRGAQTLAQLEEGGSLPCCTIDDAPAYAWRGAMLDVSRHFFPLEFVKKQIDVLASYKVNRLHLHLTDAAGWRMEIKRYPRLTALAAWRPERSWKKWWNGDRRYVAEGTPGAYGGYYTQEELRGLVAYAEERGITIVPEIEMPGHSEETLTAYPEFSCTGEPYKQADFCPGNAGTYDFLEHVLEEVMDVFPSEFIHVGGDEAAKASWPACPRCQKKMQELGLADVERLQAHLIAHMGNFLARHGRQLVGWDEIIADSLAGNTTVMIWRGQELAREAARKGYGVVLSPGEFCYLDSYQDAPPTQPEAIGGYLTLEKVYSFSPGEGMTDEEKSRIRGVQGNVWAEYIPTEEHMEYMLYPRILALAEIGWRGAGEKDFAGFRTRALAQTEKLRREGVAAFDLRHEAGNRPESRKTVRHKALNAPVRYNLPYSDKYPGAAAATLTDGRHGGWTYGDGAWQGFIGDGRLDVVVDLGKRQKIGRVSTSFMQACGAEVFYPARYIVSVSDDGERFSEAGRVERPVEKGTHPGVEAWQWKGKAEGRYVRVQALPGEFGGWIFADEIEIY